MKRDRNRQIVEAVRAGERVPVVAYRHRLSRIRVYQILEAQRRRETDPWAPLDRASRRALAAAFGPLRNPPAFAARLRPAKASALLALPGIGRARLRQITAFVDRHAGVRAVARQSLVASHSLTSNQFER